jgi:hypothetical protein
MFRAVFWDILPCKMIVVRRFRGAYCLHHQGRRSTIILHGSISQKTTLNINVKVVGCCSAAGVYIPPIVIGRGVRFLEFYAQDLLAGTTVRMTESGHINEDVFLECLQHFQKHCTYGKCLTILHGHMSHYSLEALRYCRQHHIEIIFLPPYTTHNL